MTKGITTSAIDQYAAGAYVNSIVGARAVRAICQPHEALMTVVMKKQVTYEEVVANIDKKLNVAGEIVVAHVRTLLAEYYPDFVQTPDLVVFHVPQGFVVVDVCDKICWVHMINN